MGFANELVDALTVVEGTSALENCSGLLACQHAGAPRSARTPANFPRGVKHAYRPKMQDAADYVRHHPGTELHAAEYVMPYRSRNFGYRTVVDHQGRSDPSRQIHLSRYRLFVTEDFNTKTIAPPGLLDRLYEACS